MDSQPNTQQLNETVGALENCIIKFLDYLSTERDTLLNGDIDNLQEITNNKTHALQELHILENKIRPFIDLLQSNKQHEQRDDAIIRTQEKWKNVIETLRECQRINIENGALVNTLLKSTKNALHQLHSLNQASYTSLYNEEGNQHFYSAEQNSVQV